MDDPQTTEHEWTQTEREAALEARYLALTPKLAQLAGGVGWEVVPRETQEAFMTALEAALALYPEVEE